MAALFPFGRPRQPVAQPPPLPAHRLALTAARFAWRQRFPARALYVLWAAAVVLSTLLIHEHHLADLAAGGLLALAACRLVPARAGGDAFHRADTAFLLLREQATFARRHRRYALISLILALYRIRRPKRGGLMVAGYCFLQAFDDLMDGDRPLPPKACGNGVSENPVAEADRLISEWQRGVFDTHDHYSRLAACFRGRLNAVLPPDTAREAVFQTASLLHTMRRDRLRADAAEIWPAAALAAHHHATFADSLDLLFAAAGASSRSRDLPELADALAWCSVMRDLRQDLAAGIVNIPAEILNRNDKPSERPSSPSSNCVPPPRRAGQPNSVITRIAVRVVVRFAVRFAVLISSAKRPDNPASLRSEYAEVCAYTR